jgi:hypothetical protein
MSLRQIGFITSQCGIIDTVDNSKTLNFNLSGSTTSTILTLASNQTTSATLAVPNISTLGDTVMTCGTAQTITGFKNLTGGYCSNSISYTTGTATQSGTTVTGVGTTWTSAMVGGVIIFSNMLEGFITAVNSTTSLTVLPSQSISSPLSYVLYYGTKQLDNIGNAGYNNMNLSCLTPSLPLQCDANRNILSAAINLVTQTTGILPILSGGTGSSSGFASAFTSTTTAAGTTTLTQTSTYQQYFNGTSTQTVVLPNVAVIPEGLSYLVTTAATTGTVTVQSYGSSTVVAMIGGSLAFITCILNTGTNAASWCCTYLPECSTTNLANSTVIRDSSGNFSAGTITANLIGNASTVTTNANLTGVITSSGNTTSWVTPSGTGSVVLNNSPTLTTPTIAQIFNGGTLVLPTASDTLVGRATIDIFTNKSFTNASCFYVDGTDNTKKIGFQSSSAGTSTTLTIVNNQTTTQSIAIPNVSSGDSFVTLNTTQTLTNKTLTAPVMTSIYNGGTLTLPTGTDTIVGRATTDTLSNKTLSLPVISQISNGGTMTVPSGTDTLVARTTTDTLTNKTLTNPVIAQIVNVGTLTVPTSTDTLVARATYDLMTNKSFWVSSNTYSTGTVSQSTTTVTGSSTVFTTAMIGGLLVYTNGVQAFITGFTSTTSLTVVQSQTVTSQNYVIYYGGQQEDNTGNMCTAKASYSQASTTVIYDGTTSTKQLTFSLSSATASTTLTLAGQQSTSQTLSIPNVSSGDTITTLNTTQTLTNKTLTGTTNTIRATQLATTGSDVVISGAAPGTAGGVLMLGSATTASWQSALILISITAYTSGTSFTTASNTGSIRAYIVGAGGGGGGCTSSSGGGAAGGGGGGGGICDTGLIAVSPSTSYSYTIGAGGAGGAAGNNYGFASGSSTLVVGSTTYTAGGGNGGYPTTNITTTSGANGGTGGVATNGMLNVKGIPGGFSYIQGTTYVLSGRGGYAPGYGEGGIEVSPTNTGNGGNGNGAGGSGGASSGANSSAGGAGTNGIIIIEQYT